MVHRESHVLTKLDSGKWQRRGKTGPLRFAVAMVGPGPHEAKSLVEQVVGQVQGMLPEGIDLHASIARHEPGMNVRTLVDPT